MDNVATGSYIVSMAEIKTVGVRELKNHLSAWLREVRQGARVLVTDRGTVVAEIRKPGDLYALAEPWRGVAADWLRSGVAQAPDAPKKPLPVSPVRLPEGMASRLLDEDRGEGR